MTTPSFSSSCNSASLARTSVLVLPETFLRRPNRACPSWAAEYRLIYRLATGMAPAVIPTKIHIAADLVGDTGIEPVTSSV